MASQLPGRASPSRDEARDTSRVDTLLKTPTTLSLTAHQTRSATPKELVTHIQKGVIGLLQAKYPKEKIPSEISLKGSTVTDWLMDQDLTADLDFIIKFLYNPDTVPPFSMGGDELNSLMRTALLNAFITISGGSALLDLSNTENNTRILDDLASSIDYRHIFHPSHGTFKKPLTSFQDTTKKIWIHISCFRLAEPTQAACAPGPEVDITCVFCPQDLGSSQDFLHNAVSILIRDSESLLQFSKNEKDVIQALRERSIVVLDPEMHNGIFRLFYEAVGKGRHICNKPEDYTKGMTLFSNAVKKPQSFQFFWRFINEKSQSRGPNFPLYFLMTAYTTASLIARAVSRSEQGASTAPSLDPLGFFKKTLIEDKAQYVHLLPSWAQHLFNEPADQCPLECLAQIATLQAHFSPSEKFEVTPAADATLRITGNRSTGYLHCFDKPLEELLSLVKELPEALVQSALTEILSSIPPQIKGHDRWLWLFCQTYGTDKEITIAQKENIAGYLPTLARFQLMESKLKKTDTPQFQLHQLLQELIPGIDEQLIPTSYKELLKKNPTLSPELTCLLPGYQAVMPKPALQAAKDSLLKGSPEWLIEFHRFYPVEGKDLASLLVKDTHPSLESIQFINALLIMDETGIFTFHCFNDVSHKEYQQACFTADPEKWSQLLSMQPVDPQTFIPCLLATTTLARENECLLAAKCIQTKLLQLDRPVKLALKYLPRLKELILKHGISFFREYPKLILDLSTPSQKGKPNEELDLYLQAENKVLTDGDLKIEAHFTKYTSSKKQEQAQILKDLLDLSSTHPLPTRLIDPLLTAVDTHTHNSTVEAQKSLLAFIRWAACSQINPGQLDRYLEKKQIQTLYATELKLEEQLQHCTALKNYPSWPTHAPAYHSTLKIQDAAKAQDKVALFTYFASVKRDTPEIFFRFIKDVLADTKTRRLLPYSLLLDLLINEPLNLTPAQQMPLILQLLEKARTDYPTIPLGGIDTYLKAIETRLDPDALDQLLLQVSFLIGTSDNDRTTINAIADRILTAISCNSNPKNSYILIDNILRLRPEALTSASWQKLLTSPSPISREHLHAILTRCLASLPCATGRERNNVLILECEIAEKYHLLANSPGISCDWTEGHTSLCQLAITSQNWRLLRSIQKTGLQLPDQTAKDLKTDVIAVLKTSLDIELVQQIGSWCRLKEDEYLSIYWAIIDKPAFLQKKDVLHDILKVIDCSEENVNKVLSKIQSHLEGDLFHALARLWQASPSLQERPAWWKPIVSDECKAVCIALGKRGRLEKSNRALKSLSSFYEHLSPCFCLGGFAHQALQESANLKIKHFHRFQSVAKRLSLDPSEYATILYSYVDDFSTRDYLEHIDELTKPPHAMMTPCGLEFICTQINKEYTQENGDFLFQFYGALSRYMATIQPIPEYFTSLLKTSSKAAAGLLDKKNLTLDETEYLLILTLFNQLSACMLGTRSTEATIPHLLAQAKMTRVKATESILTQHYPIGSAIPQHLLDKYGVVFLASQYEKAHSTETFQEIKRLKQTMSLFQPEATVSISAELFSLILQAIYEQIEQMQPDPSQTEQTDDLRHCIKTLISETEIAQLTTGETLRRSQALCLLHKTMMTLYKGGGTVAISDVLLDKDLIRDWLLPIATQCPQINIPVYLLAQTMKLYTRRDTTYGEEHCTLFEGTVRIMNRHLTQMEPSAGDAMVRATLEELYRIVTGNQECSHDRKTGNSLGQQLNILIQRLNIQLQISK